jgi:glycosyltransferase involved in cell wall biosynthesis
MKLLFVTTYFRPAYDFGGPVNSMWNLTRGLAANNVDVTVLTTNARQKGIVDVPKERVEENVRIITTKVIGNGRWLFGNRFGISVEYPLQMVKNIGNADIVHIQGLWGIMPIEAAMLASVFGKPFIFSPRGSLGRWPLYQKRIKKQLFLGTWGRLLLSRAAGFHFTSDEELRQAPAWLVQNKGFVVPNPVESNYKGNGDRFRKKFGLPEDRMLIGIVGRIHKKKGFDILIPAFCSCKRDDLYLAVVGPDEGGYKKEVEKMITSEAAAKRIIFTGLLSGQELADAYAAFDMLVAPSYHENFGMTVPEAALQGTPSMISTEVDLKDWVNKNDTGIVLELSIDVWKSALEKLQGDEIRKRWSAEKLSSVASESSSIESVSKQMIKHYERILESRKRIR